MEATIRSFGIDAHVFSPATLTSSDLAQRFQPVFDRIAQGALQHEGDRTLAYEPVAWLREAGFGAPDSPRALRLQRIGADESAGERVLVLVPSDARGVERMDDWHGFGQRLSASGTTRFRRVRVDPANVLPSARTGPTSMTAFFQLVHLATLAGIARAIERDAVAFVQARKRVYSHGAGATPREDPLVQQLIGHLSSTAFATTAIVRAVASGLGDIDRLRSAGQSVPTELLVDVELRMSKAQVFIGEAVLQSATRLFDVGGASALQADVRLDRHWRNARTLASHNPVIYKARVVGDHAPNGIDPTL